MVLSILKRNSLPLVPSETAYSNELPVWVKDSVSFRGLIIGLIWFTVKDKFDQLLVGSWTWHLQICKCKGQIYWSPHVSVLKGTLLTALNERMTSSLGGKLGTFIFPWDVIFFLDIKKINKFWKYCYICHGTEKKR